MIQSRCDSGVTSSSFAAEHADFAVGLRIVGGGAGQRQRDQQRQFQQAPVIDQPAECERAAVHRSARMVADVDFEAEAREAEVGADQCVGKMHRRQIELFAGQVFGPRLIERDDERRRGIELADDGDRFRGELQAGLFAEAEGVAVGHAGGDLPEMDFAAIALDDRANVVEHEREQAVEVAFPEVRPIGHAAIVEFEQRAGADSQAGRVGPFDLGIGIGPIAAAFDGFDRLPRQRQRDHVERADDAAARRLLWAGGRPGGRRTRR